MSQLRKSNVGLKSEVPSPRPSRLPYLPMCFLKDFNETEPAKIGALRLALILRLTAIVGVVGVDIA